MALRRALIPLALLAALAVVASCGDPSPTGVAAFQRGGRWNSASHKKGAGLVPCLQTYDSVTQVIGPAGGLIAVGHHRCGAGGHGALGSLPARRPPVPD